MKRKIVGIMGPGGNATDQEIELAKIMGKLIAQEGWVTLTGGGAGGVMNAALQGAKSFDSDALTIGILSDRGGSASLHAEIRIPTGMGEGRNYLNVSTSEFIIICCDDLGKSPGTMIELILTLKHKKPLIMLHSPEDNNDRKNMYHSILNLFSMYKHEKQIITDNPEKALEYLLEWV
jgi:uncharacterized protein (TIGR00725 family)